MTNEEIIAFLKVHLRSIQENDVQTYNETTAEDLTLYEWWVTPHRIDGLDAIIDTTPVWTPVVEALKNLAPGGRLVINAIRKEDGDKGALTRLDYARDLWQEKEIKSVANVTRLDVSEFLLIAAEIPIKPEVQIYALEEANQALLELKKRQVRGAKVLVRRLKDKPPMDISLTTPALLFPALSILMLAYTNRFLGLSTVIRNLYVDYQKSPDPNLLGQIDNLRYRVVLIRNMQIVGAASILSCVVCMLVLFFGLFELGKVIFIISLILLVISLAISIRELQISVGALELHLSVLEDEELQSYDG